MNSYKPNTTNLLVVPQYFWKKALEFGVGEERNGRYFYYPDGKDKPSVEVIVAKPLEPNALSK